MRLGTAQLRCFYVRRPRGLASTTRMRVATGFCEDQSSHALN